MKLELGATASARLAELRSSSAAAKVVDWLERAIVEGSDFAEAGEVLLSDAVLSDPRVQALLAERSLAPRIVETELKGLEGRFRLAALRLASD